MNTNYILNQPDKRDSLIFTVVLHLLLLLLCIYPFTNRQSTPPKDEIQGITVVFTQDIQELMEPEVVQKVTKTEVAEVQKAIPNPAKKEKESPAAPAKQLEKEVNKPVSTPPAKTKVESKIVSPSPAEVEASRVAAKQAAKAKADAEAKQKAEAEQAKLEESKSKFGSLFSSGGGSSSKSDGEGQVGDPNASALDALSTGSAKLGEGLSDRGISYKPSITDDSAKEGRVVVYVCVSAAGSVERAEFVQAGSTTTDAHLVKLAINGAKQYKFKKGEGGIQCGNITIDFKVK